MDPIFRGELQKLTLAVRQATWLAMVGLGSALVFSASVQADDEVTPTTGTRLKTVTVEAQKITPVEAAKSQLSEVPGGTSVVDSEQVAKGRTATLQDTLAYQPGVSSR